MREEIERGNGFELLTKMKNTLSSFSADFFFFGGGGGGGGLSLYLRTQNREVPRGKRNLTIDQKIICH